MGDVGTLPRVIVHLPVFVTVNEYLLSGRLTVIQWQCSTAILICSIFVLYRFICKLQSVEMLKVIAHVYIFFPSLIADLILLLHCI
jgi:hypothetical protein